MSDEVKVALIVALPLVLAQLAVIYTTHKTHKLVNSKMTDALSTIEGLRGEIRGLKAAPAAKEAPVMVTAPAKARKPKKRR